MVGDGDGLSSGGVGRSVCVGVVGGRWGQYLFVFCVVVAGYFVWLRFSKGAEKSDFLTHKEKRHVEF